MMDPELDYTLMRVCKQMIKVRGPSPRARQRSHSSRKLRRGQVRSTPACFTEWTRQCSEPALRRVAYLPRDQRFSNPAPGLLNPNLAPPSVSLLCTLAWRPEGAVKPVEPAAEPVTAQETSVDLGDGHSI